MTMKDYEVTEEQTEDEHKSEDVDRKIQQGTMEKGRFLSTRRRQDQTQV